MQFQMVKYVVAAYFMGYLQNYNSPLLQEMWNVQSNNKQPGNPR